MSFYTYDLFRRKTFPLNRNAVNQKLSVGNCKVLLKL